MKLPVLIGQVDENPGPSFSTAGTFAIIRVWCPYCRRDHQHGWDRGAKRAEFRNAHCSDGSPFLTTGYLIKPAPAAYPVPTRDLGGEG